jgi:hypothetical protein
MVVCKVGFWFQILLKIYKGVLSANVVTNSKLDSVPFQDVIVPKQLQDEADRITKQVDGRRYIYVAIKKQIQLILREECLISAVENQLPVSTV